MTRRWKSLAAALVCAVLLVGCHESGATTARDPLDVVRSACRGELAPFASEAELASFLRDLARARDERHARAVQTAAAAKLSCVPASCESLGASCGVHPDGCGSTVDCGPCAEAAEAPAPAAEQADDSITNVQHAGVDEGGIVKRAGDYLIVLRRGRLFSVGIGGGQLRPVSSIDAFGPEIDPSSSWYDELLVSGSTIVVIGYSYLRGGTEIGVFAIDGAGELSYRATHQLRSNDYYSSRNYASRLIEDQLVFYTPLYLGVSRDDLFASFPAQRKWRRGAGPRDFRRTVAASDVYRPLIASSPLTLHTVTVCALGRPELACRSTSVMGPPGRVFYVSPESVYVWVSEQGESLVYRLPLDRSAPTALYASGSPVDQFSFLEGADGHLNTVLRADAAGDGMWTAEVTAGDVALLRIPTASFSRRPRRAKRSSYTRLPRPEGYAFQNRFVGDYLLYGTERHAVFAHRFAERGATFRLPLVHGVERIEALGADAIVMGSAAEDLHFSPIALDRRPWLAPRYTRPNASQGERRSHGFFYKASGERSGVLGLPLRGAARPGFEHLWHGSASVLFVQNRGLVLSELGELAARAEVSEDDACRASCVDWYGNARPLFVDGRLFALLGYELVEGAIRAGRIRERRRVSFAP